MKRIMLHLGLCAALVVSASPARANAWTRTENTISDGNGWVLKVEAKTIDGASGLCLPCDAVKTKGTPAGVLDLSGSVSDGSAIVEIGDYAFRRTSAGALVAVTLPKSVIRIGNAFQGQSSLTRIEPLLPSSVTSIGDNAFSGLPIQGALDLSSVTNLGKLAFRTTAISSVIFGADLRTIPDYAFETCHSLRTVKLPARLETVKLRAFAGCTNLHEIAPTFPATLTSIGEQAFGGLPARLALDLSSVTNLGSQAFRGAAVTSVAFGAGLKTVPFYAFEGCADLASVTFKQAPESIGDHAFDRCTALRTITPAVHKTVKKLGENAFGGVPGSGLVGFLPAFMIHGTNDPSVNLSTNLPLLGIEPPTYRGMLSTARRDASVQFALLLNPKGTTIEGRKVRISVADVTGKVLAHDNVVAHDAIRWVPVSLPLAADAPAGSYTLAAQLDGESLPVTAAFKIVPVRPGQMFVDQDGVLLDEGKPFFPIGLYHVAASEVETAAATGINMIQFWTWDANSTNLARVKQAGLRILYEDHFWGEVLNNFSKGLRYYDFETNAVKRAHVEAVRDDPSRAAAFWYVADEPSAHVLPGLTRINDYWHTLDEDHPTYIVSTGDSALEAAADVFAVDVYPVYYGKRRPLGVVGYYMDYARQGVRSRKPVIAVLQAFGENTRHHEKPADVRCMSYLAVTHGVHGLFWYCWKETGDRTGTEGVGNHPVTLRVLTDVIAEIKVFAPALLESGNRIFRSEDEDGLIHAILCGDEKTGRFLVYVNSVDEPVEASLNVPELAKAKLDPLFGGSEAEVSRGKVTLKLAPLATGAFRVITK